VGYELDKENEWFTLTDPDFANNLDFFLEVLGVEESFPIELNRNVVMNCASDIQGASVPLDKDFFNLNIADYKAHSDHLAETKEREETLMTKSMREQLNKNPAANSRFTRIRIKTDKGLIVDATFRSTETGNDLIKWLSDNNIVDSFSQYDLCFGHETIPVESLNKTLFQLGLVPSAALLLRPKA